MLCTPASAPSSLTGLLQVTVGTLKGADLALRERYCLLSPVLSPYPPAEERPESTQHGHIARRLACNTRHRQRTAENPECRAIGPSPYLLVDPRCGGDAHWAVDHVSLGKSGQRGGGIFSHWALFAVN